MWKSEGMQSPLVAHLISNQDFIAKIVGNHLLNHVLKKAFKFLHVKITLDGLTEKKVALLAIISRKYRALL